MSTDSTELTFVRCPSCRSLVPAVSSRCRMCGSALEAVARPAGERKEGDDKIRARQKTVSNATQATEPVSKSVAAPALEEPPVDDPLSAYIEEVETIASSPKKEKSIENVTTAESPVRLEDQVAEESVASEFEMISRPTAQTKAKELNKFDADADWPDEYSDVPDEPKFDVAKPSSKVSNGNNGSAHHGRQERDQQPGVAASRPALTSTKQPVAEPAATKSAKETPAIEPSAERVVRKELQRAPQQTHKPVAKAGVEPSAAGSAGRLYGWLVSFSDQAGRAIELREGKFFVTAASIKPNDLVIDDASVSAPHAMVAVSLNNGLIIQDLMSEQGVFLKSAGSPAYEQKEESFSVTHGDWVRFGMVEFLVTVVPELAY